MQFWHKKKTRRSGHGSPIRRFTDRLYHNLAPYSLLTKEQLALSGIPRTTPQKYYSTKKRPSPLGLGNGHGITRRMKQLSCMLLRGEQSPTFHYIVLCCFILLLLMTDLHHSVIAIFWNKQLNHRRFSPSSIF